MEAASYQEIYLSLGVDDPKSILFVTDSLKEAEAAEKAGWSVSLAKRSGNAALPLGAERFRIVESMTELLQY